MANYVVLPDGSRCYAGPTCLRHGSKTAVSANFANKPFDEQLAELEKIRNPLASKTPEQIDETLSELYGNYHNELGPQDQLKEWIKKTKERLEKTTSSYRQEEYRKHLKQYEQKLKESEEITTGLLLEMAPYEIEYRRRPWTRGFLVRNANGHVHKNMSCSTCTYSTQYIWLTDYSGKTEDELVNDAGEKACTVCYPSAPVEVLNRPARLTNKELAARQEKADALQAEKARKLAAQQAKAIANPDGSPLTDQYGGVIKTEVTATSKAADIYATNKAIDEGIYDVGNNEWRQKEKNLYDSIMNALAHKYGVSVDEMSERLKPKFEAKFKRDWKR